MHRLTPVASLLFVSPLLSALAGCDSDAPADPTAVGAVLLVTWDTTRADRIGCYGHPGARTPVLDGLAAQGARFERCYATTPITLPSHVSILTGTAAQRHGVHDNGVFQLRDEAVTLAEQFQARGDATAAFVAAHVLDPSLGLDQGFDTYRSVDPSAVGETTAVVERPANLVTDDFLTWYAALDPDTPWFAWVHFYDPHAPLNAPDRFARSGLDAYDAEIAFCDEQLGRILAALDSRDDLLIAVTADHGEALGDHGEPTHGLFLYDSTMRVPWVVSGPGLDSTVVREPSSHIDIAPTLASLAGLSADLLPQRDGLVLLGPDAESPPADRALPMESHLPFHSFGYHRVVGLVSGTMKVLEDPQPQLFDLSLDPDERHDLAPGGDPRLVPLRARLRQQEAESSLGWATSRRVDDDERARLQALGYIVAPTSRDDEGAHAPRAADRLEDHRRRFAAMDRLSSARRLLADSPSAEEQARAATLLATAADELHAVLASHAGDHLARSTLGLVEMARGDFAEAAEAFEEVVLIHPDRSDARFNLALCYDALGRVDWAVRELATTVGYDPGRVVAWTRLADHYRAEEQHSAAAACLQHALEHLPQGASRTRLRTTLTQWAGDVEGPPQLPWDHPRRLPLPAGREKSPRP